MKYVRVKSKTDEYFFVKKFDLDSKKYFSGTFDNTFASISNNTITIYTPAFLLKDRGKIKKYVEKVSKVKLKSFYSDKNIIPLPKIKNIKELIYGYFWLIGWQNYYGSEGWKKYFSKFAKIIPEECKKTKPILYRGIKVSKENLSLLKKGKSLKLKNKIFSSWTDSEKIAKKFALGTIGPLAGKKKGKGEGIVISKSIPKKDIVVNVNKFFLLFKTPEILKTQEFRSLKEIIIYDNAYTLNISKKDMKYVRVNSKYSVALVSTLKVFPGNFLVDGIWKPSEKQLKSVKKILSKLPFKGSIDLLISDVYGSQYTIKPANTIILKPQHVNNSNVVIHEFGHHLWHKGGKKKKWKLLIDKYGRVSDRKEDIYNEDLAYAIEFLFGKRKPRIKKLHPKLKEFIENWN